MNGLISKLCKRGCVHEYIKLKYMNAPGRVLVNVNSLMVYYNN